MNIHSGTNQLVCSECGKLFMDRNQLATHQAYHDNLKQHACSQCNKKYNTKSGLQRHIRNSHMGKADPIVCPVCHKNISSKDYLRDHLKSVHNVGEEYRCKYCGEFFSKRSTWLRHQSEHKFPRKS